MIGALLAILLAGLVTAQGQTQNLISNDHLKKERGQFYIDTGESVAAHLCVTIGSDDDHVAVAGDGALNFLGLVTGTSLENKKGNHPNTDDAVADYFTADDGAGNLGDNVRVASGATRKAYLADGESVAARQKAVCAANGEVRLYRDAAQPTPDDPAAIIGEFAETVDNSAGGAAAPIALEVYA